MSVFTETPYSTLSFGDVCGGFPWFDAALRMDATAFAVQRAPQRFAQRYGVENLDFFVPIDGTANAIPRDTDYILAHGRGFEEAVCLSDDCVIETALGRDERKPSGQLMFAPVTKLGMDEDPPLPANFRRHLLGDDRVIELHRSFKVRAADISASLAEDMPRRSLEDDARAELAMRWAAQVCRVGPMVAGDNGNKLAQILIQKAGLSTEQATALAQAIVDVAASGWVLEGRGLEHAGVIYDDHRTDLDAVDLDDVTGPLRDALEDLKNRSEAALSALG